jgi:hypothetical protein
VGTVAFGAGACLTTWFLTRDGSLNVSLRLKDIYFGL